jgi:hypothetical protein
MRRCFALAGLLGVCVLGAGGCATDDRFTDAGGRSEAGTSATDGGQAAGRLGAACEGDVDCRQGLFCDEELPSRVVVQGLPRRELELPLFPGGSCSPLPLAPYDPTHVTSCDPNLPAGEQGCGAAGVCVAEAFSSGELLACRVACEPSAAHSGCARAGYTCDFGLQACVEGCASDDECRVISLDSDGDGASDGLAYDRASRASCHPMTARCTHPAPADAVLGGECERSDDCESDGLCITEASTFAGFVFPSGACTKLGCEIEGRECGQDGVCGPLRPWSAGGGAGGEPLCMVRCPVGAEPAAQRLGVGGHGVGCREGYRCHYNGGAGEANGVCVGGNYNDINVSNVGDDCASDAECYSPFGLGRCLRISASGISREQGSCTVVDCGAPGLPRNVCGAGNACVLLLADSDVTFCVRTCTRAEECADAAACADDDADPTTPRICFPACFEDAECRVAVETCEIAADASAGRCVALTANGG